MARRQARRGHGSAQGPIWFAAGMIAGLGLATVLWLSGWWPSPADQRPDLLPLGHDDPPLVSPEEQGKRRYDFFTLLPEVEVLVPSREIEARAREDHLDPTDGRTYTLQAGSFRSASDAEALRAQITLLGLTAQVQTVTVDESTWHRVRVGPFDSAREANSARRRLQESGLEAMVLTGT